LLLSALGGVAMAFDMPSRQEFRLQAVQSARSSAFRRFPPAKAGTIKSAFACAGKRSMAKKEEMPVMEQKPGL
jgi:uncharacterized protein (DUF169 family)